MNNVYDNEYKQYESTKVNKLNDGEFVLLLTSQPTKAILGIINMLQNDANYNRVLYVVTPDKKALTLKVRMRATSVRVLSDYGKVGIVRNGQVKLCDNGDLYDLLEISYTENEWSI